jgi:hypothetical protein
VSRTALREPSQAHHSPWLVQTKVSLAHCQPTIGQSSQCPSETTDSPVNAQPSQWPAEPLTALAMATQIYDQTSPWLTPAHVQPRPWWSQNFARPLHAQLFP